MTKQNCNAKGNAELQREVNGIVNCDIVSNKEDLDHCVEVHKDICIVLNLYVDVEGQLYTVQGFWAI